LIGSARREQRGSRSVQPHESLDRRKSPRFAPRLAFPDVMKVHRLEAAISNSFHFISRRKKLISTLVVTDKDFNRLQALIESSRLYRKHDQQHIDELEQELNQAQVVPERSAPAGIVTMYSIVDVTDLDTGKKWEYQLVLPKDANSSRCLISILAPIGTALLGYSVGTVVDWKMPGGQRRLRIDSVKHTAKHFLRAA
jgi:regulator of nucleoside diphosphate kinase